MERARETGLFRYSLVQELTEPGLSQAERGWRARELAGRVHEGPGGRRVTVSYSTLTRWRRRYEEGGFDALVPSPRQPAPRTPAEVLALAEALKREKPGRTAAQVRRVLQVTAGWAPSDRTLQRLFGRLELNRPAPGPEEEQRALGRFVAIAADGKLFTALDVGLTLVPAGDQTTALALAGAYRPQPGPAGAGLGRRSCGGAAIRGFLARAACMPGKSAMAPPARICRTSPSMRPTWPAGAATAWSCSATHRPPTISTPP